MQALAMSVVIIDVKHRYCHENKVTISTPKARELKEISTNTTLHPVINAKLGQRWFWPCQEKRASQNIKDPPQFISESLVVLPRVSLNPL